LKKTLIIDGRDRDYMEAVLSNNGYIVHRSFDSLQIVDEHAVNNPDKVAVVLVNAGCPPTLLKVEVEDLEMYFLRTISEIGGTSK
jgi:ABC-2 type transport system ATP-binding protein